MKFFNLHTHQYSNQEGVLELVNQYPQEFDATIPNYSMEFILGISLKIELTLIWKLLKAN